MYCNKNKGNKIKVPKREKFIKYNLNCLLLACTLNL